MTEPRRARTLGVVEAGERYGVIVRNGSWLGDNYVSIPYLPVIQKPSVTRNQDGTLYVDLTKLDYVDGEAEIDAEELREEIMMKSMISYDVGDLGYELDIEGCAFFNLGDKNTAAVSISEGAKSDGYLRFSKGRVEISDVTVFSGRLTDWQAIRWGLDGLRKKLRNRIRGFFRK